MRQSSFGLMALALAAMSGSGMASPQYPAPETQPGIRTRQVAGKRHRSTSKYEPHQGAKELARAARRAQAAS